MSKTNAQALNEARVKLEVVNRAIERAMQDVSLMRRNIDDVSDSALVDFCDGIVEMKARQHILELDVKFYTRQAEKAPDGLVDIPF